MKFNLILGTTALLPVVAQATVFMTIPQVQQVLFPAQSLQKIAVSLTDEQQKWLAQQSGINTPFNGEQVYRAANGGWLIIDHVLGKHELITYAVALNANGTVRQVEILEYRESYGGQVRNVNWRQQFVGKSAKDSIKLNSDIKNISGATLSSQHITDGVRRISRVIMLLTTPKSA